MSAFEELIETVNAITEVVSDVTDLILNGDEDDCYTDRSNNPSVEIKKKKKSRRKSRSKRKSTKIKKNKVKLFNEHNVKIMQLGESTNSIMGDISDTANIKDRYIVDDPKRKKRKRKTEKQNKKIEKKYNKNGPDESGKYKQYIYRRS